LTLIGASGRFTSRSPPRDAGGASQPSRSADPALGSNHPDCVRNICVVREYPRSNAAGAAGFSVRSAFQMRNVQRRFWRECGYLCFGAGASSSAKLLTPRPGQQSGLSRISGPSAGGTNLMLGASGRYRFIGISVSSNAVSGSSTEATAEAQTAAPSRKRISAHEHASRLLTPSATHPTPASARCQSKSSPSKSSPVVSCVGRFVFRARAIAAVSASLIGVRESSLHPLTPPSQ